MKQKIQAQITLLSPTDKTVVPIQITYDDDEDAANLISEISLVYNNIEYCGKGTDYLWVDTFVDLQSKLPSDIKLACCMTCRHGSMCPYGNRENLLFCTKDVIINNKEDIRSQFDDLCNLFDKGILHSEQEVFSYNYCDNFVYQSDDYFTYNDYGLYLKEKNN